MSAAKKKATKLKLVPKLEEDKVAPIIMSGGCNTPDEVLLDQVRRNIRLGIPQVQPYDPHPATALLICGGPSLQDSQRMIFEKRASGSKIVAVNGAYKWCLDHNLQPSAAIMLDAREFNSRFLERDVPGCRYILASQCHPKTFEMCRDRDLSIWHACSAGDAELELLMEYYFGRTHPIQIGTTVGVRAISVLRMLGFTSIEIFGLDSCWLDGKHHAYEQPENEKDKCFDVWLKPKDRPDLAQKFKCSPWHAKQAEDFQRLIKERGDLFRLHVHGPGLIAAIMQTGAEIERSAPS